MVMQMRFSAEYVDKLSPVDRKMYILYFEKDKEEEAKRQTPNSSGVSISNNIPDNMG